MSSGAKAGITLAALFVFLCVVVVPVMVMKRRKLQLRLALEEARHRLVDAETGNEQQ